MKYTDANAAEIGRRIAARRTGPPCQCPVCAAQETQERPRDLDALAWCALALAAITGAALALVLSAIQGV